MNDPTKTVLVVEDEPHMRRFLKATLKYHGYRAIEAATGARAIEESSTGAVHLVLLDLGLPDIDGASVASHIRARSGVPIIVISARAQERDKIDALDRGANDYMTKPFGAGELMARIRVALRGEPVAQGLTASSIFHTGELTVDHERHQVSVGAREIRLTPTEYDLLAVLIRHADRVVRHEELLREVWGPECAEQTQYLRVYMRQLRYKIETEPAQPKYLVTVLGVGYRLRVVEGFLRE